MQSITLKCPQDVWPKTFTGHVALGVTDVSGAESLALWLVWDVVKGDISGTKGLLAPGRDIPRPIRALEPAILALADRGTWEAISADRDGFLRQVEEGAVHIGGDYRTFGRYSPALLRLAENSDLWQHLDAAVDQITQPEPPTS